MFWSQQCCRNEAINVFTEVGKIALSADYDKRLQMFGVKSYPYGTGTGRVCKTELIEHVKMKTLDTVI